ncbi:predicted protein [Histoplasma mississippiense (nom. inval.)]|uniref:predicted protein n=1 Tax=Ajellomyces capsulatus (strain NAm1 / WU24) TaxID=2059318 RepID=UPI000157B718|nr:predicted protein [Histoplasma mississippiense (nom. inval.)]EDN03411.1 predicted protein [Histoplasma mississippiense (nom. inval.)]
MLTGISVAQANTRNTADHKKQYSILHIGYCVAPIPRPMEGNLIGPQTFRESQAPEYIGGFIAIAVKLLYQYRSNGWLLGFGHLRQQTQLREPWLQR